MPPYQSARRGDSGAIIRPCQLLRKVSLIGDFLTVIRVRQLISVAVQKAHFGRSAESSFLSQCRKLIYETHSPARWNRARFRYSNTKIAIMFAFYIGHAQWQAPLAETMGGVMTDISLQKTAITARTESRGQRPTA
jgi:hypothetical protein